MKGSSTSRPWRRSRQPNLGKQRDLSNCRACASFIIIIVVVVVVVVVVVEAVCRHCSYPSHFCR